MYQSDSFGNFASLHPSRVLTFGLNTHAQEDDEGELDDYEDDGEELDDLDNLKEFDLEDDEQRVAALEAEVGDQLKHFFSMTWQSCSMGQWPFQSRTVARVLRG